MLSAFTLHVVWVFRLVLYFDASCLLPHPDKYWKIIWVCCFVLAANSRLCRVSAPMQNLLCPHLHRTIEKFPNLWHSWHLHARRWHLLNSKCSCSHLSTDGDVGLVSQCVQEHCTRKHLHYCATKTTSQVKWNVVLLFTWLAIGIHAHRRIHSACFTWGRTAKVLTSETAHQCI